MGETPAWVIDLDGVVWLSGHPIAGSVQAVGRLIATGADVAFATNSAWYTVGEQEKNLLDIGIDAHGRVITSAQAAARCCRGGERAFLVGGPGLQESLDQAGVVRCGPDVDPSTVDVVVVGMDRDLTYDKLAFASRAIRAGARFVLSNADLTYPTPEGLVPGAGSIGAAIESASGTAPLVAGKPEATMAELLRDRLGPVGLVVGDRDDTDGAFARALGYRFAMVLSGVTTIDTLPTDPSPDLVGTCLADVVDQCLGLSSHPG